MYHMCSDNLKQVGVSPTHHIPKKLEDLLILRNNWRA